MLGFFNSGFGLFLVVVLCIFGYLCQSFKTVLNKCVINPGRN